jgi:hypothetical protein
MTDQPDRDGPDPGVTKPGQPSGPASGRPAGRPEQSAEDTDTGWGERPDGDDDERYYRDRPPHWGSD